MAYNSKHLLSRPWVCTSAADQRWLPWAPALTGLGFSGGLGSACVFPLGPRPKELQLFRGSSFMAEEKEQTGSANSLGLHCIRNNLPTKQVTPLSPKSRAKEIHSHHGGRREGVNTLEQPAICHSTIHGIPLDPYLPHTCLIPAPYLLHICPIRAPHLPRTCPVPPPASYLPHTCPIPVPEQYERKMKVTFTNSIYKLPPSSSKHCLLRPCSTSSQAVSLSTDCHVLLLR